MLCSSVAVTSIRIPYTTTIRTDRTSVDDLNDLDDYAWLTGDEAAKHLSELGKDTRPLLERLTALRKTLLPSQARLVNEQIELRRKAESKFGEMAARMFFNPLQLQQATDLWIARYKAARFASKSVTDFCCGIGGDLLALAERGSATGIELDPRIALLAEKNLACLDDEHESSVQIGDVAKAHVEGGQLWHVDPDRRIGERRSVQIEFHSPSKQTIDQWLEVSSSGAVKLAPASVPPLEWQAASEQEWISRGRECKQLVLWFGALSEREGKRRATSLRKIGQDDCEITGYSGQPAEAIYVAEDVGRYIYDPDPALTAANLTGSLANEYGLATLGPGATYLTSDTLSDAPLLSTFEVLEALPPRAKLIAKFLQARNIGRVEIKVRGVEVRPEQFRKKLKLEGDDACSLILTRIGQREMAIVAQRA